MSLKITIAILSLSALCASPVLCAAAQGAVSKEIKTPLLPAAPADDAESKEKAPAIHASAANPSSATPRRASDQAKAKDVAGSEDYADDLNTGVDCFYEEHKYEKECRK